MSLYYAEHNYAAANGGLFTDDVFSLADHVTYPPQDPDKDVVLGQCSQVPQIKLSQDKTQFTATVSSFSGLLQASVTQDRFLKVDFASPEIFVF